jgi:glycosyltransferase involved in cell wall biosynthesis
MPAMLPTPANGVKYNSMKIAFIDHLPLGTGIPRLATRLAKSLVALDKNIQVTYFTHSGTYHSNKELYEGASPGFKVEILKSSVPVSRFSNYSSRLLSLTGVVSKNKLQKELASIKGYDVVYFTAAHMSPFYKVEGKKFATFHDFNWKYSFGTPNFSPGNIKTFNEAMPQWFDNTVPIVSSHFIKTEIEKFYPAHKFPIEVIYLPNIGAEVTGGHTSLFDFPYILYPANLYPHKNHQMLFQAMRLLKENGKLNNIKLVLTGGGTDHFKYAKFSFAGIEESNKSDFDVLGMGYVDNNSMDSLIKNAILNVSASVYEAGSGPAIDAWINKVPFIMSDIAPHRDQLKNFNLPCILFDPYNASDIAAKIDYALQNIDEVKSMSLQGHEALKRNNWQVAAKQYMDIFTKYCNEN